MVQSTSVSTASLSKTPRITNLTIAVANTEEAHVLVSSVKQLEIKSRTSGAVLKYSFVLSESGTNYITIPANCFKVFEMIEFTGKTLYIQSNIDGTVVEIEELY